MSEPVKKVRLTSGELVTLEELAERVSRRVYELWQTEARRERARTDPATVRSTRRPPRFS